MQAHRCVVIMNILTQLTVISVLVQDQDEALRFYTEILGLEKRADVTYGPGMRWLTVGPIGQRRPEIALARPDALLRSKTDRKELLQRTEETTRGVFNTDDCCTMYSTLLARGVTFISPPTKQLYGMEALFADPFGNIFSLLEPSPEAYTLFKQAGVSTAA